MIEFTDRELLYFILGFCAFISLFCVFFIGGTFYVTKSYSSQISSILNTVNDFQTQYYPQITETYEKIQNEYIPTVDLFIQDQLPIINSAVSDYSNFQPQIQSAIPQIVSAIPQIQAIVNQAPSIFANIQTISSAAQKAQSFLNYFG